MIGTQNHLAATPNSVVDAFSDVLELIRVRGHSAGVLFANKPQELAVPAGKAAVYIVEHGEMRITPQSGNPITISDHQIALLHHDVAHQIEFPDQAPAETAAHQELFLCKAPVSKCFYGRFTVDGALAARLLDPFPETIVLYDLHNDPIELIAMIQAAILDEVRTPCPGSSVMVSRLLDLLLVKILRRWADTADIFPGWLAGACDARISRALSAIHSNYARDLTNAELARLAGMSVSSFADRFKQTTGRRPGAYLREWRLNKAAEALRHSHLSIERIADRVGYRSKEAFSRAFHSEFGVSPSKWRESALETRPDEPFDSQFLKHISS